MSIQASLKESLCALQAAAAALSLHLRQPISVKTCRPCSVSELDEFEREFSLQIPVDMRMLLTEVAGSIKVESSDSEVQTSLPPELAQIYLGGFEFNLERMKFFAAGWREDAEDCWRELFTSGETAAPISLQEFLPFMGTACGDLIGIAHSCSRQGEVFYLDHEDGEMNWIRLGRTFKEFLSIWFRLGCVGPDYDNFEPFYDAEIDSLSLEVPESGAWIRLLGLDGKPMARLDIPLQIQCLNSQLIKEERLDFANYRNVNKLVTSDGRIAIQLRNAHVWNFQEGLGPVHIRNRCGVIDEQGNLIIEPNFEYIGDFTDGLSYSRDLNGDCYFIDRNGRRVEH